MAEKKQKKKWVIEKKYGDDPKAIERAFSLWALYVAEGYKRELKNRRTI